MTRVLNRGNRPLIEATLEGIPLDARTRLLDVGFGGGLLLELAHRRGVRKLAGVDPSEAAVAWLRGEAGRFAGAELRVERGVAEALPFDDASFDVVASTNTVNFWPDPASALAELRRVLAPRRRAHRRLLGGGQAPLVSTPSPGTGSTFTTTRRSPRPPRGQDSSRCG